ncbi:MAG: response regulator [Desulfomonile tiedjei]|uniref:Response regulator n=1 Tax=Desulfomonile tiedjei TaxID=2358 RepID=A0A9D6Z5S8_9BACT|nr:response regulator [Desulfomonile tiedjei]
MDKENKLFLIVDDEPDMCWLLEHLLEREAYSVMKASSGREAMKLMESHKFGLAFVDLKLDDMEGLELAHRFKLADPSLRIVMVSGFCYRDDPTVQKALADGLICDFIPKPFLHAEIIKSIESARSLPTEQAQVLTEFPS